MTQRVLSASKYMLDAFFLSLLLVFIDAATTVPLVFVWLLLSGVAALVSLAAFLKAPYRPEAAVMIGSGLMSLAFFAGASVITVLLFSIAAVYRLHVRFSVVEEEIDSDNRYLFKFTLLFGGVLFISLINPETGKSGILYVLAISTVSYYIAARMLHRYLNARNEGASIKLLLLSIFSILGLSGAGSALVYSMADDARFALGALFGRIVSVALWPLAALMDKLVTFLNNLAGEEQKQQKIDNMETGEMVDPPAGSSSPAAADFPFELVSAGILLFLLFLLMLWVRKAKIEKHEEKKADNFKIERSAAAPVQAATTTSEIHYAMMDLDIIREAFRNFEREAARAGKGRESHETVREWLKRMGWTATDLFFGTYDFVRYGDGQISETRALPFLEEIKEIKEKYLKSDV